MLGAITSQIAFAFASIHGFAFQDTSSYVQFGSGLEGDEQHEDIVLYFMPESEAGALYDVEELAAEVTESARRATSLNHPSLQVLRKGPKSPS